MPCDAPPSPPSSLTGNQKWQREQVEHISLDVWTSEWSSLGGLMAMLVSAVVAQNRPKSSRKRPRCLSVQHVCKGAVLLSLLQFTSTISTTAASQPGGGHYLPSGPPQGHDPPGWSGSGTPKCCAAERVRVKRMYALHGDYLHYHYARRRQGDAGQGVPCWPHPVTHKHI